MNHVVCPWWLGYLLLSPIRRLRQDPAAIVGPHVRAGMTVLEPGPGMGFFTLEIARRVEAAGRVVVVDVQTRMLDALRRRAERAGVAGRVETRLARGLSMGIEDLAGAVDFCFAFAVVHELPDRARFFEEAAAALKPRATLLVAEPKLHVSASDFDATVRAAVAAGLAEEARPAISGSRSVLFAKKVSIA
jgi:ubiquinone/menaquinone biosynthesis C-methylase UbiE